MEGCQSLHSLRNDINLSSLNTSAFQFSDWGSMASLLLASSFGYKLSPFPSLRDLCLFQLASFSFVLSFMNEFKIQPAAIYSHRCSSLMDVWGCLKRLNILFFIVSCFFFSYNCGRIMNSESIFATKPLIIFDSTLIPMVCLVVKGI